MEEARHSLRKGTDTAKSKVGSLFTQQRSTASKLGYHFGVEQKALVKSGLRKKGRVI